MRIAVATTVALGWSILTGLFLDHGSVLGASLSPASNTNVECAIHVQPGGDFLRLEAIVRSDGPVRGQYELAVFKESATGTTQNHQSGAFELTAAPEAILTTVILDRPTIGHYQARLTLDSNFGRISCTSP
jgi:hypothetical protein